MIGQVLLLLGQVHVAPDPTKLPGSAALQTVTDGLGGVALAACAIGILVGAVMWAIGVHAHNPHRALAGRRAVATAVIAAVLVGATGAIVNWAFELGTTV